ncbi:hypothetical protein EDB80DRAFT_98894 [Ilyonectria destructans]|nr:hypothetical protein EDB80DRAFT_98894 [Ilyonectria destructans]
MSHRTETNKRVGRVPRRKKLRFVTWFQSPAHALIRPSFAILYTAPDPHPRHIPQLPQPACQLRFSFSLDSALCSACSLVLYSIQLHAHNRDATNTLGCWGVSTGQTVSKHALSNQASPRTRTYLGSISQNRPIHSKFCICCSIRPVRSAVLIPIWISSPYIHFNLQSHCLLRYPRRYCTRLLLQCPSSLSLRCFLLRITRTIWNGHVPFLFLCVFFFAVLPTSFSGL